MSRINPYASIEKRTFQAAVIHLLETEYRIVGSHRILKVLAEDIEALVAQFYPKAERLHSGNLIWTCTGDEGQKAQPGKPTEAYKTVTVCAAAVGAGGIARACRALWPRASRDAPARAPATPSRTLGHGGGRARRAIDGG